MTKKESLFVLCTNNVSFSQRWKLNILEWNQDVFFNCTSYFQFSAANLSLAKVWQAEFLALDWVICWIPLRLATAWIEVLSPKNLQPFYHGSLEQIQLATVWPKYFWVCTKFLVFMPSMPSTVPQSWFSALELSLSTQAHKGCSDCFHLT